MAPRSSTATVVASTPSSSAATTVLALDSREEQFLQPDDDDVQRLLDESKLIKFHARVVWRNVALFVALHIGALVGAYQLLFQAKWATVLWTFAVWVMSFIGNTAGSHRLWAHRSYKARFPLRVLLIWWQTMAFQNDVLEWCRDHRCHHKWTDTDADPHNTRRGFFFAHMGWLLMRKHPQIKENGRKLNMSDLERDPVVAWQHRHYLPLVALLCFLFPTAVPVYLWGESASIAFYTAVLFRYCSGLHVTWLVNSVAHFFGYKPYDLTITPVESTWVNILTMGEGGHNYHHTFPQDYRTSEYSFKDNWTRLFIDGFAAIGWAYDLKVVTPEAIERQKQKQRAQAEGKKTTTTTTTVN